MHKLFFISLTCLVISPLWSADHYIRDGATGALDGTSWTDAWDDLPSTLTRGDTYYIADGTYTNYDFNDAEDGTTYIYIKKATESAHGTETGWNSTYGDGVATFTSTVTVWDILTGYWDIDGVVGDGDGSVTAHGFKVELTSTTDGQHGINMQSSPIDYISLKHIEVTSTQGASVATGDSQSGIRSVGGDFKTLAYCYIHAWKRDCVIWTNSDNNVLEYNYFKESHSTATAHGQAIYMGLSTSTEWDIRYNTFKNINGSGVIFMSGACSNIRIYGNLFWEEWAATDYGQNSVSGIINHNSTGGDVTGLRFYNNTIIDHDNESGSGNILIDSGSDNLVSNNIWYSSNISGSTNWTDNYNAYDVTNSGSNEVLITSTVFTDYAGGDFTLSGTFPASWAGTTLSSPYTTDMLGETRGVDGTWDRGAYEYGAGTPSGSATLTRSASSGIGLLQ